jgi:hypothetical protein
MPPHVGESHAIDSAWLQLPLLRMAAGAQMPAAAMFEMMICKKAIVTHVCA